MQSEEPRGVQKGHKGEYIRHAEVRGPSDIVQTNGSDEEGKTIK